MASSSVYKAPCTWTCLGFVDLVVCLTQALLLWVFTLWIGLFCFAFSVSPSWVLMALILSMLRVSLCCVSDSWVNCDGRRVCASDSGRSRKWLPFVLQGWGREWAGSAPLPQLGECHPMWRAYLLTARCVIAVCLQSSPCGRGEDLITPGEVCARTDHWGSPGLVPWVNRKSSGFPFPQWNETPNLQYHIVWKGIPVGVNLAQSF